ncbi:GTPase, partial [Pseudomonas aeruginosa]
MDRSLIKSMMPSLVAGHMPRNVRSFKYRVFDDQPQSSTLGFAIDPQPFNGKVVSATDDAIVVKLKPSEFAVLDPNLVTTVPSEGAKVHVQPY